MAENPKFNNSNMFTDVINDTTHNDILAENNSEVLATQGNVINSIKVFWNKLRRKLVHAITRDDISKAVGGNYQPIFVNENGGVQVCVPTTITGKVVQGNISLDEIDSPYSGQIVCINVTNTSTTSNNSPLTIKGKPVYYPTDVQVKVSDVIGGIYLFTYIKELGNKWILNNKINVASDTNSGLMTADQCSKLAGISEHANYFTYTLPTASANEKGGVKSSSNTDSDNNQKIYHVGVDTNGIMTVNVPWQNTHNTALLKAGGISSKENQDTINGSTYLQVVENNTISSQLNIKGSKGVTVSSSSQGVITIEGQDSPSTLGGNNFNTTIGYLVYGPGRGNNNTSYFLAGNGTWQNGILVPVPNTDDSGKILKCGPNGPYWATE